MPLLIFGPWGYLRRLGVLRISNSVFTSTVSLFDPPSTFTQEYSRAKSVTNSVSTQSHAPKKNIEGKDGAQNPLAKNVKRRRDFWLSSM